MVYKGVRISEICYNFAAEINSIYMTEQILDYLISIDKTLTVFFNFNGGLFNDTLWDSFSSRLTWVPLALAFLFFLYHKPKKWKEATLVVLALVLIITLCDQVTSTFMKPYFARLRPSHTPGVENLLHYVNGYRGGRYGFASSHAANSFGAVTYVSLIVGRRKISAFLFLFALMVCYSRIYLGVHYLGDLMTGALIGTAIAYTVYRIMPYKCRYGFRIPKSTALNHKAVFFLRNRLQHKCV